MIPYILAAPHFCRWGAFLICVGVEHLVVCFLQDAGVNHQAGFGLHRWRPAPAASRQPKAGKWSFSCLFLQIFSRIKTTSRSKGKRAYVLSKTFAFGKRLVHCFSKRFLQMPGGSALFIMIVPQKRQMEIFLSFLFCQNCGMMGA